MPTLVVGASGATGHLLVKQLLDRGEQVKAVVRTAGKLPESITEHENLTIVQASILEMSDTELVRHVRGCSAVASCLGHNLNLKGIWGHPRRLVTDATRRLCEAVRANRPEERVKFVLMNTAGNSNRDLSEPASRRHRFVIWLLRRLLPPQADNEAAADYLRTEIGQSDNGIEWAAVRPDSLVDEPGVTEYDVYPSPVRDAIFDPGRTSRINVAHFMAELITDPDTWNLWKGQMPVLYNRRELS